MYVLKVVGGLFAILDAKQRMRLYFLMLFFLFSALVQVVGVASISPFVTLLSDPDVVHKSQLFKLAYEYSGVGSVSEFILLFAGLSLLMIVLSNAVSALTLWVLVRFSVYVGGEMQERLYSIYLNREYIFHKTSNYNRIISMISAEAPRFVYMVLQPFLILVSQLLVAVIIVIGLLAMNPLIAAGSALIIGGSYLLTYVYIKKFLVFHGHRITLRNDWVQRILSESFIGIKDIKLNGLEPLYLAKFNDINNKGLNSAAAITLAGDLPRFVIETISFGAIIILAILLLKESQSPGHVVSLLSVYALAGYKLLPTLQQVYKSVSSLSANGSVVHELKLDLLHPITPPKPQTAKRLASVEHVVLKDVSYTYPNAQTSAVNQVSLSFHLGALNTIAGHSGSGKSTLADIMLGLLPVESGQIYVNGSLATGEHLTHYQQSIGYVPQHIFILDDSVVANVAFGVPNDAIDLVRVELALKQASALEFVSSMPNGIHTQLGQDGKLLSGGQRQRIGIARALYRQSRILILDEPTSALDIHSEYELMSLLGQLKAEVLIVVISHRPAAIKMSDKISIMEKGSVVADGTYETLIEGNEHFREMMEKGMM